MTHVVGADVGSQSVKAVVMDPDGAILASACHPCTMSHPASGWAEQDPADWREALGLAVRAARDAAGVAARDITGLGLACQVDGLVALDAACRPLRPAVIWLDRRAAVEAARLAERVGGDALMARTGLVPDASHGAPKAMWLTHHEPEVVRDARWLAPVAGAMCGWLTGSVSQDHANASSSLLYDVRARDWAPELADAAGLDLAQQPEIRRSHDVAGTLTADAAEALGLQAGCAVVVGTGDDHAAALGAGAAAPGVVVDVTGTAEPVVVPAAEAVIDAARLVETHAHAVDGMLLVENPGFVSGGSTAWCARALGVASQADVFAQAALAPAGSEGVLFIPALSGSMAPRWNDAMRGAYTGLALVHGPSHMARAVLEGCAYALRDIVDRFRALGLCGDELRVVGGGARSELWLQIKADVTSLPVRCVLGEEATATGAAMLAAVAVGRFPDLHAAIDAVVELAPEPYLPDPGTSLLYADGYDRYRATYDALEGVLA